MLERSIKIVRPSARRAIRIWRRLSVILAIIGLASIFDRLIKWAQVINAVVIYYKIWRDWLFSFAPIALSSQMRDAVILTLIAISITEFGAKRQTGKSFLARMLPFVIAVSIALSMAVLLLATSAPWYAWLVFMIFSVWVDGKISFRGLEVDNPSPTYDIVQNGVMFSCILAMIAIDRLASNPEKLQGFLLVMAIFIWTVMGGIIAWRWLLAVACSLLCLISINEAYQRWLIPLGY